MLLSHAESQHMPFRRRDPVEDTVQCASAMRVIFKALVSNELLLQLHPTTSVQHKVQQQWEKSSERRTWRVRQTSTAVLREVLAGLSRHLCRQLSSNAHASPLAAGRSARYTCHTRRILVSAVNTLGMEELYISGITRFIKCLSKLMSMPHVVR